MLTNQIIQKVIQDTKRIANLDCAIWNAKGDCIAMTTQDFLKRKERVKELLEIHGTTKETEWTEKKEQYFLLREEEKIQYCLVVSGEEEKAAMAGRFAISQLKHLMQAYAEKSDGNSFVQSILLEKILPENLYHQAKRNRIQVEKKRVVYLIEPKKQGLEILLETVKELFHVEAGEYAFLAGENRIALVKQFEEQDGPEEHQEVAEILYDTLSVEAMVSVRIAYGKIANELGEISRSYKEAETALKVGQIFYEEKEIFCYQELGVGRLLYQLPEPLCKLFLEEVFGGNTDCQFEKEELTAVYTFLDNNLNISETARQLYLHRNTLVYRLEKIQKKTGLDVRKFEDAMLFKLAMMVENYMSR